MGDNPFVSKICNCTLWKMHNSFRRICSCSFTKDHEHIRRLMKSTIASGMSVEPENTFPAVNQKVFFTNSQNKQTLIELLAVQLEAEHHTVAKCTDYYSFYY